MDNSFFAYLQQLELMAFFSGYPLIYAIIISIAGKKQEQNNFKSRIVSLLPLAYALVGTLYLGLQLKNAYPNYSFDTIQFTTPMPWFMGWGLLSVIFWIPVLNKKAILSLLHSLVFLFFLSRDIYLQLSGAAADDNIVRNDMKIYSISLAVNLAALAFIVLVSFLWSRYKSRPKS